MSELTIVTLCHVLSNLTHNRCHLVENSNTCVCVNNPIRPMSPTPVIPAPPDIMLSEVILIFFVLAIWLSAIAFCLNQYKSLRRLETQVHYCVSRKDPLNIGEIKIVAREQDSIIYQKKRYSTMLEPQIDAKQMRAMRYVQSYLPKPALKTIPSAVSMLVANRETPLETVVVCQAPEFSISSNSPTSKKNDSIEEKSISDANIDSSSKLTDEKTEFVELSGNPRLSAGLTIPKDVTASGLRISKYALNIYGNSRSAQHLCVPLNTLRCNHYSAGNISMAFPHGTTTMNKNDDEELLDPRLIPESVRRSLLALHRESQENVSMQRNREKTQSENDVHGAFYPWKSKMKSKLKRTHQRHHIMRPHANTVTTIPIRNNSNEQEQRSFDHPSIRREFRYSTPASRTVSAAITPSTRRSLIHYPKYSTQSTSESEATQGEIPMITSIYVATTGTIDNETTESIVDTNEKTLLMSP